MPLPILYAETPLSVPAKTYDKVWIELVEISAPSPAGDATATVRLRRFGTDAEGNVHTDSESQRLEVKDILATSQTDPDLAAAVQALMGYIAKAGIESGVIAPPAE
jgi:hypothetical protein